jgi:hypothetical protein
VPSILKAHRWPAGHELAAPWGVSCQLTGGDDERLAQLRGESLRTHLAELAAEESPVAAHQRDAWCKRDDVEINRNASGWRR